MKNDLTGNRWVPALRARSFPWFAACAVLATVGVGAAFAGSNGGRLSSGQDASRDTDMDGLLDRQERVLNTSSYFVDTDGDAYSDLEELARHMSPTRFRTVRPAERLKVAVTCHARDRLLHVVVASYVPNGDFRQVTVNLGMYANGRMVEVSRDYILENSQMHVRPALKPGAKIVVLDVCFPNIVATMQDVTFFVTAGKSGSGVISAADSAHLFLIDHIVVLEMKDPIGTDPIGGGPQPLVSPGPSGVMRTIFVPLQFDDEEVPDNWTPGQVCFQSTTLVGGAGALVTSEVVTAECKEGWDGGCPPSCSSTVGSTSTTLDPLILIGG